MTTAQEILEMIENVDPDDTEKLDEIDSAVLSYRLDDITKPGVFFPAEYTRSRWGLKVIRPHGWCVESIVQDDQENWFCSLVTKDWKTKKVDSGFVSPTEELAELHAIIQAIDYERSQK